MKRTFEESLGHCFHIENDMLMTREELREPIPARVNRQIKRIREFNGNSAAYHIPYAPFETDGRPK